jgi:hypothetical protein
MSDMTHIAEAERWLYKAANSTARGDGETAESCAAIAQVHVTLASLAASPHVAKGDIIRTRSDPDEVERWVRVGHVEQHIITLSPVADGCGPED